MSHLSDLIAAHMRDRGLTIEQVARHAGLGVSTVGHFKKGSHGQRPSLATLEKLARGLGPPITPEVLAAAVGLTAASAPPDHRERFLLVLFRALPDQAQQHVIEQIRLVSNSVSQVGRQRGSPVSMASYRRPPSRAQTGAGYRIGPTINRRSS